jgi:hypothetical protein
MTPDELRRHFPNSSASFLSRNPEGVRADDEKPAEGGALVGVHPGKEAGRVGRPARAGITFRVFSCRPADFDGWHLKECIDVLVKAEILDDDCWDLLEGRVISEKVYTKEEERTEVLIEWPAIDPAR